MKMPGPDHPISFNRNPRRVRVQVAGHVIADSDEAIALKEADFPTWYFFPRSDVETGFLSVSPDSSDCEYKGHATQYGMSIDGELFENVAKSYEHPYPAAERIKGMIAFDPSKVEVYEVDEHQLKHMERF